MKTIELIGLSLLVAVCVGGSCGYPATENGQKQLYEFGLSSGGTSSGDSIISQTALASGGTQAEVDVHPAAGGCDHAPPYTSVRSSNPAVLSVVETDSSLIHITGLLAGDADLELLDKGGAVIDQMTIHVRQPASLEFSPGAPVKVAYPMPAGPYLEGYQVRIVARSSDGLLVLGAPPPVLAAGGMVQSVGAVLPEPGSDPASALPVGYYYASVVPGKGGAGTVSASSGTASAAQSLEILDPGSVDGIDDSFDHGEWTDDQNLRHLYHRFGGTVAGAPLFGASCIWDLSDSRAVQIASQVPGTDLARSPAETTTLIFPKGHFTATCRMGKATRALALDF